MIDDSCGGNGDGAGAFADEDLSFPRRIDRHQPDYDDDGGGDDDV